MHPILPSSAGAWDLQSLVRRADYPWRFSLDVKDSEGTRAGRNMRLGSEAGRNAER